MSETSNKTRLEHDCIGQMEVPANVYWGIHTQRAIGNFPVSGITDSQHPELIRAYATVKRACAIANEELGLIDPAKAEAIRAACLEIEAGKLADQFPVDVMQGGAGTSSNMNMNEVIANRALEIAGRQRGDYTYIHPNDDVNKSQSTNDTYPAACKLALIDAIGPLAESTKKLAKAFHDLADKHINDVTIGRTQLQDAVPMTYGQEFHAFATLLKSDLAAFDRVVPLLAQLNLGATAIGTGICADLRFRKSAIKHLAQITGLPVTAAPDPVAAMTDMGAYVATSAAIKSLAVHLKKAADDLRLLNSGPRCGFNDLNVPARQAGSSIMPAKVNPVDPRMRQPVLLHDFRHGRDCELGCGRGTVAAERLRPGDGARAVDRHGVADARHGDVPRQLRGRHRNPRRSGAFICPVLAVDRRRTQPLHRLRARGRHRRRSRAHRSHRARGGRRTHRPARRAVGRDSRSDSTGPRPRPDLPRTPGVAESTVGRFRFLPPRLHDFTRNDRYSRRMTEYAEDIARWFQVNAGKLIWLTIVLAIVFVADRVISRVLRKILDNSQIPSASIFVNLTRVTIWVTGAAMVLQPVFGINPTTLITALGVGGVAISLGLKDTIANIIGGFGLMLGRVIQPGDLVTIQGVTGTVHDITWRQTVVRTRSGDMMVIPNSVLNTAALTKLTPVSEGMATLEFTAKASGDPSAISQDILDRVTKATADVALEGQPPLVKFTGFSPYGMTGQVLVFAREGVLPSTIKDMAARAIAGSGTEYLVEDGGSSGNL